jgi:hypothetical protein
VPPSRQALGREARAGRDVDAAADGLRLGHVARAQRKKKPPTRASLAAALPVPTRSSTEPPEPRSAAPVEMLTSPDAPAEVVPVLTRMAPETPF